MIEETDKKPIIVHICPFHFLQNEYENLRKYPVNGVYVSISEDDVLLWNIEIIGPQGTFYMGTYKAVMTFPKLYPFEPPKFQFKSNISHPNVSEETRDLYIPILRQRKRNMLNERSKLTWDPNYGVRTVLMMLMKVLKEPIIDDPVNSKAALMYLSWKCQKNKDELKKQEKDYVIEAPCAENSNSFELQEMKECSVVRHTVINSVESKQVDDSNNSDSEGESTNKRSADFSKSFASARKTDGNSNDKNSNNKTNGKKDKRVNINA